MCLFCCLCEHISAKVYPGTSCVDPASDIQICSIVNYYFRISLAGSPAMDLLDVANS